MESKQDQIKGRREEIVDAQRLMVPGVAAGLALCIITFVGAVATGNTKLYELVMMVIITVTFFTAAVQYMIHRSAGWIKYIGGAAEKSESVVSVPGANVTVNLLDWEDWKDSRRSTYSLWPVLVLGVAAAPGYVLYESIVVLWYRNFTFLKWSIAGVAIGILANILTPWLARK